MPLNGRTHLPRLVQVSQALWRREQPQRQIMMNFIELVSGSSDRSVPFPISCDWQWLPAWPVSRAHLRDHTESDLQCYFCWCAERGLDSLTALRARTWSCTAERDEIVARRSLRWTCDEPRVRIGARGAR